MVTKIDIMMSDGSRLVLIPGQTSEERARKMADILETVKRARAMMRDDHAKPESDELRPVTERENDEQQSETEEGEEPSEPEPETAFDPKTTMRDEHAKPETDEPRPVTDILETVKRARATEPAPLPPAAALERKKYKEEPLDDTDWKTVLNRWVVWYGKKMNKPMTISEMVKSGGMHPADFTKFRKGTKRFSYYMQDRLARFLGVTVDQLKQGPPDVATGENKTANVGQSRRWIPITKTIKPEPNVIVQAIIVKTICDICEKQPGYKQRPTCDGCPLKRARFAEGGPCGISNEYKAQRCLNCARKHHGQCDACRLTQAIYAQGLIDTTGMNGMNDAAAIHDAVAVSETRYQAAMYEIRERHDTRA